MTTTLDEQALLQAIADNPEDYFSIRVLSDLLKEQDRELEAEVWSWFAEKQVHPNRDTEREKRYLGHLYQNLIWWWQREYDYPKGLLRFWMESIHDETYSEMEYAYNRRFSTPINAYKAAVLAYTIITPEQRKECWEWQP